MGYQSEEEQVEALKKWWRESGTSILAGIGLAVAVVFGWQAWQGHQEDKRLGASVVYQDLQDAWEAAAASDAPEAARSTFSHLVDKLKSEYPGTVYSWLGGLQMARLQIDQGNLDAARTELQWVMDGNAPDKLAELARIRLARVMLAQEDPKGALLLIDTHEPEVLAAEWEELRGDLLMAMEQRTDAIAAYRRANELATAQGQRRPLLELKLDDLAAEAEET